MATAAFEESPAHRRGLLGVSKSSTRIGKIKRGGAVPAPAAAIAGHNQRPPPTVYKIEPEGFRSLVQELTGPNSSSVIHHHRQQQQQQQHDRVAELPLGKISSNRLQSLAPPPIAPFKPSFYTPISSLSPKFELPFGNSPKLGFPPLSFSPLADLTPRDSVWASGLESPEINRSATSFSALIAGGDDQGSNIERTGSFTFSPKFSQGSSFPGGFGFNGVDFSFTNL